MVTSSLLVNAPSSVRQRRTYVPGSLNVTWTGVLPSAGIGSATQIGAHGEFAPARVSSHGLTCGGSNVTLAPAGPRYRNHETWRPTFLPTVTLDGGCMARFGRAAASDRPAAAAAS